MSNNNKDANLKEKFKQALTSTFKVISEDFEINNNLDKNDSSKKFDFLELDNLNTKSDFIKARAESDSLALKKKFSDETVYKKNLPTNPSCKSLYLIAEKIRYESLGGKMLKGIKKNLDNNYNQTISLKRRDQLKTKEDVSVTEAFELYMLKEFLDIELSPLTKKMMGFWESDFNNSVREHINFLKDNLENQDNYSSKFSQILQGMDIFETEDNEQTKEENQDNDQNNPSNDDQESENDDNRDQNKEEESEASLDADYDIDEYKLDEQLAETDNKKQNNEQLIQKKKC